MPVRESLRSLMLSVTKSAVARSILEVSGRGGCAVLVMHRFAVEDGVHVGHDLYALRRLLDWLRRSRVKIIQVEDAARAAENGTARELSVAFTVDDGYADLGEVAAPIFAEFDCPVTSFVVPDVVDGRTWFWWDKIDWTMRHSDRTSADFDTGRVRVELEWSTAASRVRARSDLENCLKRVPASALNALLDQFAHSVGVQIPEEAPVEYSVLDWDRLRLLEGQGFRFGAHSLTHPILSRCTDEQARQEVIGSIARVTEELSEPANVFCYPNGLPVDFGRREYRNVRGAGVEYAVTTEPGILRAPATHVNPDWRLELPRVPYSDDVGDIFRRFL